MSQVKTICYLPVTGKTLCDVVERLARLALDIAARVLQVDTARVWAAAMVMVSVMVSPRCWAEYLSLQSISRRCLASLLGELRSVGTTTRAQDRAAGNDEGGRDKLPRVQLFLGLLEGSAEGVLHLAAEDDRCGLEIQLLPGRSVLSLSGAVSLRRPE